MNNPKGICRIVMSLITNSPVIRDWGFNLPRLPTIIVPVGQTDLLVKILLGPESRVLDMFSGHAAVDAALTSANSSAVLITYTNGVTSQELIHYVSALWKTGFINNQPILGLPVLITESRFSQDTDMEQFFICMENITPNWKIDIHEVVPDAKDLPIVAGKIGEVLGSRDFSQEEKALIAALCFIREENHGTNVSDALNMIHEIYTQDDELHDPGSLGPMFEYSLTNSA